MDEHCISESEVFSEPTLRDQPNCCSEGFQRYRYPGVEGCLECIGEFLGFPLPSPT